LAEEEEDEMILPLDITIHGIGHSDAIEAKIRERAQKLNQFCPRVTRCEVWINAPHGHHKKGDIYDIRLRMTVPGEELVVDHQPERDDVYVAIRESFDAARRQLEDYERRQGGRVKRHEAAPQAIVEKLFPIEGYGFLKTPEGKEIYFHRNSVRDVAFEELRIGTPVAFNEEEGAEGPQATVVRPLAVPQAES
jgi:''Cold-shock'' DNA-binding domain./Sigma 54 modulation protein / S30EA ribosomal protein.